MRLHRTKHQNRLIITLRLSRQVNCMNPERIFLLHQFLHSQGYMSRLLLNRVLYVFETQVRICIPFLLNPFNRSQVQSTHFRELFLRSCPPIDQPLYRILRLQHLQQLLYTDTT